MGRRLGALRIIVIILIPSYPIITHLALFFILSFIPLLLILSDSISYSYPIFTETTLTTISSIPECLGLWVWRQGLASGFGVWMMEYKTQVFVVEHIYL